ncbi:MAG: hypothetical protein FWD94_07050 [Treponema sp.]|nr:hypothetical protein [Treponema sp.]
MKKRFFAAVVAGVLMLGIVGTGIAFGSLSSGEPEWASTVIAGGQGNGWGSPRPGDDGWSGGAGPNAPSASTYRA